LVYVPIAREQFLMKVYQGLGLTFSLEQIAIACEEAEEWQNEIFSDYTLRMREAFTEYNQKILEVLGAKGDLRELAERVSRIGRICQRKPTREFILK